ncbi:MAG TPA: hypothetical protein VGJ01_09800 [Pseudolabrys sp.]
MTQFMTDYVRAFAGIDRASARGRMEEAQADAIVERIQIDAAIKIDRQDGADLPAQPGRNGSPEV